MKKNVISYEKHDHTKSLIPLAKCEYQMLIQAKRLMNRTDVWRQLVQGKAKMTGLHEPMTYQEWLSEIIPAIKE